MEVRREEREEWGWGLLGFRMWARVVMAVVVSRRQAEAMGGFWIDGEMNRSFVRSMGCIGEKLERGKNGAE